MEITALWWIQALNKLAKIIKNEYVFKGVIGQEEMIATFRFPVEKNGRNAGEFNLH